MPLKIFMHKHISIEISYINRKNEELKTFDQNYAFKSHDEKHLYLTKGFLFY